MTIEELIIEALTVRERFWFVEEVKVIERTDSLSQNCLFKSSLVNVANDLV
jgi:hypothetical protein